MCLEKEIVLSPQMLYGTVFAGYGLTASDAVHRKCT